MNRINQFLKKRNIRPSISRMSIYHYIVDKKNHPTVDMIYSELHPLIPTLSRTTVYNTVRLFLEKGLIQLLSIGDNEARYDANLSLHGHFKCTQCNAIYDFIIQEESLKDNLNSTFKVNCKQLFYYGQCDRC